MAISVDIEKLERRWLENPSGLMFAPLAEAHRKAGNHVRALEILEAGLLEHPDYVPALIVRGRCHLNASLHDDAERSFNHALERDPVNPIALRGIAEAYELTGRNAEAIERLELLIEVDRGDLEAREALERIRGLPESAAAAPVEKWQPDAYPGPEPETVPGVALELEPDPVSETTDEFDTVPDTLTQKDSDLDSRMATVEADSDPTPESLSGGQTAEFDPWHSPESVREGEADAETAEEVEPETEGGSEEENDGATAPDDPWAQWRVSVVEPPSEVVEVTNDAEGPAPADEVQEEELESESVDAESVTSFSSSWAGWASWGEERGAEAEDEEPIETVASDAEDEIPVESETVEAVAVSEDTPETCEEGEDQTVSTEEPALIVTESMAELFLQQGHRELALAVYRQLASRSDDDHLSETIVALEAELADLSSTQPGETFERPSFAAADTGGRSVGEFLRDVLDAPPPSVTSKVHPPAIERGPHGEPTREAEQPFSLAAVFSEESPSPTAIAEVGSSPETTDFSPHPTGEPEPSYDEFFGSTVPGDTEGSLASAPPSDAEDLHQFNEWLKGLKR